MKEEMKKIKMVRVGKNITQKDVADYLELSPQGYRLKESGKNELTLDEMSKLSEILELDFIIRAGTVRIEERKEV